MRILLALALLFLIITGLSMGREYRNTAPANPTMCVTQGIAYEC